jgi:hypothetical protein
MHYIECLAALTFFLRPQALKLQLFVKPQKRIGKIAIAIHSEPDRLKRASAAPYLAPQFVSSSTRTLLGTELSKLV